MYLDILGGIQKRVQPNVGCASNSKSAGAIHMSRKRRRTVRLTVVFRRELPGIWQQPLCSRSTPPNDRIQVSMTSWLFDRPQA